MMFFKIFPPLALDVELIRERNKQVQNNLTKPLFRFLV